MWSRYLRTRERDGVVAIFHELHPIPIFCSVEQWNDIEVDITGGTVALIGDLKRQKLIISTPEDDLTEFKAAESLLECKLNQPSTLYLMTAQGCNFACKYCPVPEIANKYGESILLKEDAFAGIDLWQEHIKDMHNHDLGYCVVFYGGEPLLNKKVIKQSLRYLKAKKDDGQLPRELCFMVVTNGFLVDSEFVALCKEYDILVVIGLDGPRSVNDVLRVDASGNGTFDKVVAAIKPLVQNEIRTFASVSITPFNIGQIESYYDFFSELGIEKFGFNFLKGKSLLKLVGREGLDGYYRKAARGVIGQARRQGRPNFEYQMEKKQNSFHSRDFFPVDCTCYGEQLVIQPDGQISNCPFCKTWLGHVREVGKGFRIWNQPTVREWRKRLPLYHPGEAKALCGGGCAWSSLELKGDLLAVDDSSKIFSEEVLNEFIWSQYNQLQYPKT